MAVVSVTGRTSGLLRRSGCDLAVLLALGVGSTAYSQGGLAMAPAVPLPDAPLVQNSVPAAGVKVGLGQISGTVIDSDADIVPGAQVTLVVNGGDDVKKTTSDESGVFRFSGVGAGKFTLTASYPRMTSGTFIGVLHAGETLQTLPIKLDASASESVQVVATQEELAEAEIHVEEQQRLFGIVPNFYTSYDWHAAPLTVKQKFELAWKNVIDPGSFFVTGVTAGIEQANDTFPGYNQGAAGYAKRYGAASGDLISGTYLGGAILPALFHQDPRYFWKGTGTIKSRTWYAITRVWICRGDNGKNEFNYSGILGDLAAGALANTYYPPGSRDGAALTFEEGGLNLLGDAAGNIVQEFALKHLTPHSPNYAITTKDVTNSAIRSGQP
jgi:hypothetical protein